MKRHSILIMEDEEVLLDVLKTKLEKEGYDIIAAKNGEEGLEKLQKKIPDLILLDIIMPKLNGYEVLERIQKNKVLKHIPIIIISNSGQPVEIDKALSLGASDYLIKAQFAPDEVIQKVNKALQKKIPALVPRKKISAQTKKGKILSRTMGKKKHIDGKIKTILIVEDDQFLRELIARKLDHDGFIVHTATDGKEGIGMIEKQRPDLVLLDIILSILDGFEVLKLIRTHNDSAIKKIPIILLSNLGQDSDIEKGKKLGATDYLIKASFTTDQIVEKIKRL